MSSRSASLPRPIPGGGVNTEPGSADDGWTPPPPVKLDDGSHIQLFKDGQALSTALSAIENAKKRICLEVYIFANDSTGQRFKDALARKAREGVEVYLIYDDFGSISTPRKAFLDLRQAGVRIRVFHPLRPWETRYSWRPFNRDHRKLLVIDDALGGLGGLNIADEYAGEWVAPATAAPPPSPTTDARFWRDNCVGIAGPSVLTLSNAFARTWNYIAHGGRIARALYLHPTPADPRSFAIPPCGNNLSLLASVPSLDSPLRPSLHRLFAAARKSIRMTMAYFAPDDDLVSSLSRAARRGVDVQLMLPGVCDVPILITAARSFYDTLLHAGVKIYERQSVVLHAKTMVIDDQISILGSTNLDYRSIEYNLELSAVIRSEPFARQMTTLFNNDVKFARQILPTHWKRRPTLDRIGQWAVSRARYLL